MFCVFRRYRKHNLKLQSDKCEFLHKEIAYLGHIISDQDFRPNSDKIEAIVKIPVPRYQKDIKSFVSLASYYRKFIPNFSQLAKPLTSLLKKECTTSIGLYNVINRSRNEKPLNDRAFAEISRLFTHFCPHYCRAKRCNKCRSISRL